MNIFQKLKVLFALNKQYKEIREVYMREGIKTTEFWMTLLVNIGNLVAALSGSIDPKTASIISAASAFGYQTLRSLSKQPDITTLVKNESAQASIATDKK